MCAICQTLIFCSSRILNSSILFFAQVKTLRRIFLEEEINALDLLSSLPQLRVLSASVVNVSTLTQLDCFPQIEYLSFVFGVRNRNIGTLFSCFPNLNFLGCEFDELTLSLIPLIDEIGLDTLQMSWNQDTFWKRRSSKNTETDAIFVCESDIRRWLYGLGVRRLILDVIMASALLHIVLKR